VNDASVAQQSTDYAQYSFYMLMAIAVFNVLMVSYCCLKPVLAKKICESKQFKNGYTSAAKANVAADDSDEAIDEAYA
jgi:hypothetical protein